MEQHNVINTWKDDKIVFEGSEVDCRKYVTGNNIYQMNYSKLKIVKAKIIEQIKPKMEATNLEMKTQVGKDLIDAMKAKNPVKVEALRAIKGAIDKFQKENEGDIDYVRSLKPLVKQRTDSIEQFNLAGNTELAEKEAVELAIINEYLVKVQPKQLSEEEIKQAAAKFILAAGGKHDMGKIMSFFKQNYTGQYDGKTLSTIVKSML